MKKKMFLLLKILLGCLAIFLIAKWIIAVPVQRHYGYQKLYKYMDAQGIKRDDVKDIKASKDYLKGWYDFKVELKDFPNHTIFYTYTRYKDGEDHMVMSSIEYEKGDEYHAFDPDEVENFKYPPLPKDWENNIDKN